LSPDSHGEPLQEFQRRFLIYSSLVVGSALFGGFLAFMATKDQVIQYMHSITSGLAFMATKDQVIQYMHSTTSGLTFMATKDQVTQYIHSTNIRLGLHGNQGPGHTILVHP
jgi:hypothetical protein